MNLKELHAQYKAFGHRLMKVLHDDLGAIPNNDLAVGEYERLDLPHGYNARFLRWGYAVVKPYYIIIFDDQNRYKFEVDVSKVQLMDSTYSWFLGKPTNRINQQFVHSSFDFVDPIPPKYREAVKSVKARLKAGVASQRSGYRICENSDKAQLEERFSSVVAAALSAHWGVEIKRRRATDTYTIDDKRAIEGYERDRIITSYTRNRSMVVECKRRNDNTCEVCGFRLVIGGSAVIECHHVDPVRGGIRVTRPEDLICLCPTCHRIAHQRELPYSVGEIMKIRDIAAKPVG